MAGTVQGGCVVCALGIAAFAVVFAISEAAGILSMWAVGTVWFFIAVARRQPVSTTPPPLLSAPSEDVYAGETGAIERVERGPEGVVCIIHPVRTEARIEKESS